MGLLNFTNVLTGHQQIMELYRFSFLENYMLESLTKEAISKGKRCLIGNDSGNTEV